MNALKHTLLAATMAMVACGQLADETGEETDKDTPQQQINSKRIEAENCCYCLVNSIFIEYEYYNDIYCFAGTEQQCVTALVKGGDISSYNRCFNQLCAGDCWFLVKV